MLHFICHPALQSMLEQSSIVEDCERKSDVAVITDYLPQKVQPIHAGLKEASKYRLFHPYVPIIITSFFEKKEVQQHDTFNILSLNGTNFVRLPCSTNEFEALLKKLSNQELIIFEPEWIAFSITTCTALIKESIKVLNHGNKFEFVNTITCPLMAAATSALYFPESMSTVNKTLESIKPYLKEKELLDFFNLSKVCATLPDDNLQTVTAFVDGLKKIEAHEIKDEADIRQLIYDISRVNDSYDIMVKL